MATENINALTATVTPGAHKGDMAVGILNRITQGTAMDFMTPEQVVKRLCSPDDPYVEIEIVVEGIIITKSYKDYTRIGEGAVPQNSDLGQLMTTYELATDDETNINMIAREIGRDGKSFIVWDVVTA